MPITINEQYPRSNKIYLSESLRESGNGAFEIFGKNNVIEILNPIACAHLYIKITGDNSIKINHNCVLNGVNIHLLQPGSLDIGEGTGFNGHSNIHMHESAKITIGRHCLIAAGTNFASSHVHKIVDAATGERLNPPGDITLEDHVWSAGSVHFWGGSYIGRDSVVGQGTMVSRKKFPPNSLIVGTPARIAREGINWEF